MIKYKHLLGKPFIHGRQDCYEVIREFFRDNFDIHLSNYARPNDWWNADIDLYADLFRREGFDVIDEPPHKWRIGDCFLIAVRSRRINHAAVLVDNDQILHHFYNRRSEVTPYKGMWRELTCCMVRHRQAPEQPVEPEQHDVLDLLPPHKQRILRDALG